MKKIVYIISLFVALGISACGDDEITPNKEADKATVTVTVTPSAEDEGQLVGEGLKFRITSFTGNTAEVFGTTREVDKSSYSGGFVIPANIVYNGKKYAVTSVGAECFKDFSRLTSVALPSTLIEIGENAFYKCSSLTSIEIPNSVTSIGDYVFYGCSGLTSVTIPESVTYV